MRIVVIIASRGRAADLALWREHCARQTLAPHAMIWAVHDDNDLPTGAPGKEIVCRGPAGLTRQRNVALEIVPADADVVAFFDDDYVPSARCLEGVAAAFEKYPDVVGFTGVILADGAANAGIALDEAFRLVEEHDRASSGSITASFAPREGLYGCNMAYRTSALRGERFDEALPLYAWQEDIDFSNRIARHGAVGVTGAFAGVHRGAKGGRTSGVRLGYSQIANPLYLRGKGTISRGLAAKLMLRNVAANHAKMLRPEPWVDRRGRVAGNWRALRDLVRGRLHPGRVLDL